MCAEKWWVVGSFASHSMVNTQYHSCLVGINHGPISWFSFPWFLRIKSIEILIQD